MLYTEKECAAGTQKKSPITAQTIINDIILSDDPENIRENLHEMILAFFMYFKNPTDEFKGRVYYTYVTLYHALKEMETLNQRRKQS